jgi:hypothetical protein
LPVRSAALLAGLLLAGALLSLALGQDANWDLQNYHLYDPFALLQGRWQTDLFAAGIQTFLNPLLDVPYYLLATRWLAHAPRLLTALAGLPYGVLVFLIWRLARVALRPAWGDAVMPALLATLIGATGTATWGEIGTTFGDIPIAVLVLGGCLLLLDGPIQAARPWRCGTAGLLIGAACGLKPTAVVFAIPAALALVAALLPRLRHAVAALLAFAAGGAVGGAALYGWWGLRLWQAYANPVAPFANGLFRSAWFPSAANTDPRFKPAGLLQGVVAPFEWVCGGKDLVAEIDFRDARFACAWLAVAALLILARHRAVRPVLAAPSTRFLLVFTMLSFAAWEDAFSIIRYAVALEALTGILILLALRAVADVVGLMQRRRLAAAALLAVLLVVSARYGSWGRIHRPVALALAIPVHHLPPGSLVLIAGKPRAFLAPFLQGDGAAFLGVEELSPGTLLWREAARRVADHAGPLFVLGRDDDAPWPRAPTAGLGVRPMSVCAPLANPYQRGLMLCPAERVSPPG